MTKTSLDVITDAHRHLGLLSTDETPTADQDAYARAVLDAVFAEMNTVQGMAFAWDVDTVPDAAFLALSRLLSVEIAQHYGIPTEPRSRAVMRLRAFAFENDNIDRRDTDSDGVISTDEAAAGIRALYY